MNATDDQFGEQLTNALRQQTEGLAVAPNMAASARGLHEARTRRRLVVLGAAALAIAAIGVAFAVPRGNGPGKPPSALPPTSTVTVTVTNFDGTAWIPDGFRNETVGDIELAIPKSWQYGDLTQWCISAHPELPMISRPGGFHTLVGCGGDTGGYGVQFGQTGDDEVVSFAKSATVRTKKIGDTTVYVGLKDATLADEVIATVHRWRGSDANGCPLSVSVPTFGKARILSVGAGPVSVCRYDLYAHPRLDQSERLIGADADDARKALRDAPRGTGPDARPQDCTDSPEAAVILLKDDNGPIAWVHFSGCDGHGVDNGSKHRLTGDVMAWALSPGYSGEVPSGLDIRFRDQPSS